MNSMWGIPEEWVTVGQSDLTVRQMFCCLSEADLDTSLTAFNEPHFGMSAKKIVVDIDQHELDRMELEQVAAMQACDAGDYIRSLYHAVVADEKIREQSAEWRNGMLTVMNCV